MSTVPGGKEEFEQGKSATTHDASPSPPSHVLFFFLARSPSYPPSFPHS